MSDPVPTREETVKANMATVISTYTKDAFQQRLLGTLEDINVSLAMLVDNDTTPSAES